MPESPRRILLQTLPYRKEPVKINEILVANTIEEKYLLISPTNNLQHEKCGSEEVLNLKGSYLIILPYSCRFTTMDFEFSNQQGTIQGEPVHLPHLPSAVSNVNPVQLNLKSFGLDQLSELTLVPNLFQLWTLILCGLIPISLYT